MDNQKLFEWREKHAKNRDAYRAELQKMEIREQYYDGSDDIFDMKIAKDRRRKTGHVRNICGEMVESQVNSTIPQPRVQARMQELEPLAQTIEAMLRNELDRMPFEAMNDMLERTVPIQGGAGFLVEWDNRKRTHNTIGELSVQALHPSTIIPQAGVYSQIEDMDYIFVEVPTTKQSVMARYGVDVSNDAEEHPENRGDATVAEDMVTQIYAYYRNDDGGIGLFSWVNNTVLEDLDNYQARRVKVCADCGEPEPPDIAGEGTDEKKICRKCGGTKFVKNKNDYETVMAPIMQANGNVISPNYDTTTDEGLDPMGEPMIRHELKETKIPYYCPNRYPVVLIKNVSKHGKFLGGADVDRVIWQQNTSNRTAAAFVDRVLKNGSVTTLPKDCKIENDPTIGKTVRIDDPVKKQLIDSIDLQADISQTLLIYKQVYEEAREIIGITDSFQGRHDPTATSGKAKEFAAAQSAGRIESKRVMRDAAYAELFRLMFLFKLAYTDEPRPVVTEDANGDKVYSEFSRYDFLRQDEDGNWYWLDDSYFLFSTDVTAPLANNREAMWEETRNNLQMGAFGNPQDYQTLVIYWGKMEQLHYPGAAQTKKQMEELLQRQMQMQQAQMQQQMMMQQMPQGFGQPDIPQDLAAVIDQQARQAAMRDAGMS